MPLDPNDFLFLPPRATTATVQEVENRANNPYKLIWGIPEIDARMIPAVKGDFISFLARQGMGKTTTMITLARNWAKQCRLMNPKKPPLVVYCTWETTVEEFIAVATAGDSGQTLEAIGRGQADIRAIKNALVKMLGDNVAVVGRSATQSRMTGTGQAMMPTIADVGQVLLHLRKADFDIAAVFFDYLQAAPGVKYDFDRDRTSLVTESAFMIKDLAMNLGFVAGVGVQADRRVDNYEGLKFPRPSDAQWASAIEQVTDKMFALTIPSKYLSIGQSVELKGWRYSILPSTLGVSMAKQRFGPYGKDDIWLLDADFSTATFKPHPTLGEVSSDDDEFV